MLSLGIIYFMFFAIIAAFGFLGKYIAELKGRNPMEGFLLGIFLGLLGVLIEALLPRK
jgi:uncharacterized membrane protein YeaQ/YmgE (transglycosylase-associated protein family)